MFFVFVFDRKWQPELVEAHNRVLMPTDTVIDVAATSFEQAWAHISRHLDGTEGSDPRPAYQTWHAGASGRFKVHAPRRGYKAQAFALQAVP